ncbi:MAG: (2Fe-2S)-binding protein [Campylobacterales bacterium]|nr:(2Fe-2S)-binding protein [Campylobacterales bacterium]
MIEIFVNDQSLHVNEGVLLIEALIQNRIDIPYFCYHEALGMDGNCRMCMVGIEGQKRPQIACDTIVKAGMRVHTTGERIEDVRRRILELELVNHPVDCPICDQAGECKLQDFYMDYGLYDSAVSKGEKVHGAKHVDLGANVMLDQERCVLCARCTRFTCNITKTHELGIIGRGDHARISTMPGRKLSNPYAMNVVDLCPVGALTSKDFRFAQRVWFLSSTPSVCHSCAKGCNIFIDHNAPKYQKERIYRFRPRRNDAVNGHFICDAGRLSYKSLNDHRLTCNNPDAMDRAKALIQAAHNIALLVDANLYCEQLDALVAFAQRIGAQLYCPNQCYYDEGFGDEWLRRPWRAANLAHINTLGITQSTPSEAHDLIISFNHPDLSSLTCKHKIAFSTHEGVEADVVLALRSWAEEAGTLINITA